MTADTTASPKVWPVKHSPLLRAPERFVSRDELREHIRRLTDNLVSIEDKTGEFLLRLDEGTTKNVNTMAPFLALACRYEETGDGTLVPWLDTWAEWAMRDMPRTPRGGMQHVTLA